MNFHVSCHCLQSIVSLQMILVHYHCSYYILSYLYCPFQSDLVSFNHIETYSIYKSGDTSTLYCDYTHTYTKTSPMCKTPVLTTNIVLCLLLFEHSNYSFQIKFNFYLKPYFFKPKKKKHNADLGS